MIRTAGDSAGPRAVLAFFLLVPVLAAAAFLLAQTASAEKALLVGLGALFLVCAVFSVRVAVHFLIFSMLLSPEIQVAELGRGGSAARNVTLRFEDLLIPLLAVGWLARLAITKEGGLLRATRVTGPFLAFIGWNLVCTGIAIATGGLPSWKTPFFFVLKYAEFMTLFLLAVNYTAREEDARAFVRSLFVTGGIVAVYALLLSPPGRATAPFEGKDPEPNTLGGYLLFLLSLAAGLLLERTPGLRARGFYAYPALLLAALAATLSRASFVGFGIVWGLVGLRLRTSPRALAVFLAASIAAGTLALPEKVRARILETFPEQGYHGQVRLLGMKVDESTQARVLSWGEALEATSRRPFFGHGASAGFVDAQFFRVLVEAGIPGLLLFLVLLRRTYRLRGAAAGSASAFHRGLAAGFGLGFLGLLGHSLGSNTWYIVRIMEPFWLVAGILAGIERVSEDPGREGAPEGPARALVLPAAAPSRPGWS